MMFYVHISGFEKMASILGIQPFVFGVPVPSRKRSKNHIPPIFFPPKAGKSSTRLKSSMLGEGYVSSLEGDLSDVGLFYPVSKQNMLALNGILPPKTGEDLKGYLVFYLAIITLVHQPSEISLPIGYLVGGFNPFEKY